MKCSRGRRSAGPEASASVRWASGRGRADSIRFEVLGYYQLVNHAERNTASFIQYYGHDIQQIQSFLTELTTESDEPEMSLRLALATIGTDDAATVRDSVYEAVVLEALSSKGGGLSLPQLSVLVSNSLRVSRSVQHLVVDATVRRLADKNLAILAENGWGLTKPGEQLLQEQRRSETLMQQKLKETIRERVEQLLGRQLQAPLFELAWTILRRGISEFLQARGSRIAEDLFRLLSPGAPASEAPGLHVDTQLMLAKLAETITETCFSAGTVPAEDMVGDITVAFRDSLLEPSGPVFEMLRNASIGYVALCTMGLAGATEAEVRGTISRTALALARIIHQQIS